MAQITLENAFVEFPVYNVKSNSLKNHLLRFGTGGHLMNDVNQHVVVRALDNINLKINNGDRVGLVGHNGAGKSTLLRLLSGIYEPVRGHIHIDGKISTLLSLMEGLDHESNGYDNIRIRGIISGLSPKQIKQKTEEIAAFSELGGFLSMPIRTYSSGMLVRLAFAITTAIDPEIMIIDEVFGAGDAAFMEKAEKRMIELFDRSSIVVFASHSNDLIRRFCNRAILFNAGKIVADDEVETVLKLHESGGY